MFLKFWGHVWGHGHLPRQSHAPKIMPKRIIPLTDLQIRNAKKKAKPYKLADGGGLYLEVMPSGSKIWRLKYRQVNGKENRLTFGTYPEVALIDARAKRQDARNHLATGSDPVRSVGGQVHERRCADSGSDA